MIAEFSVINLDKNSFSNDVFSYYFDDNEYTLIEYRFVLHKGIAIIDGLIMNKNFNFYSQNLISSNYTANRYLRVEKKSDDILMQIILVKTKALQHQIIRERER